MTKQLDQLEGKLSGTLLDNLSAEASTASIRISFYDSDNPTVSRTPNASTLKFCIDPENTQGKPSEWIRCASHSTTNGITTLVNVTRGLQRDHTYDLTGSASRAQSWDASTTPVGVATEPHNINLIKAYFEGTEPVPGNMEFDGNLQFDGDNTYNGGQTVAGFISMSGPSSYLKVPNLTTAQRTALTASNGMIVYDTDLGLPYIYKGGSWFSLDTGTATPNASETVTGSVQLATDAQAIAGTDTDGGDPLVVKPSQVLDLIQTGGTKYAVDSVGTDAYAITLTPALSAYSDGLQIHFEAGTANTGASTLNINSLGAIPIVKGDYYATITGDILEDQKVSGLVSVKSVTFNAVFTGGETSGTLSSNWTYKSGVYSVLFSNGDRKDVTLTKSATTATWSGGLSGAATASASAQWFQLTTQSSALIGENNGSLQHYHDLVLNNSFVRRRFCYGNDSQGVAAGGSAGSISGLKTLVSNALNNAMASQSIYAWSKDGSTQESVHNKNPSFRFSCAFNDSTAQEGFIGWCPYTMAGTDLENSVMTLDHLGFIVEDGTLYISVADGATQSKLNISATVPSVTVGHIYMATFDGTTATFYVDNVLVGTRTSNVPNSSIDTFRVAVISDVTAAAKTVRMLSSGWAAFDEL